MTESTPGQAGIVMYSSKLCPYCMMANRLLSQKDAHFEIRSVDGDPDARAEMIERSGLTSVPQIFIGAQHVGGCDDLFALEREGKLDELLAGAVP